VKELEVQVLGLAKEAGELRCKWVRESERVNELECEAKCDKQLISDMENKLWKHAEYIRELDDENRRIRMRDDISKEVIPELQQENARLREGIEKAARKVRLACDEYCRGRPCFCEDAAEEFEKLLTQTRQDWQQTACENITAALDIGKRAQPDFQAIVKAARTIVACDKDGMFTPNCDYAADRMGELYEAVAALKAQQDFDITNVTRAEVPGTGKTMDELRREEAQQNSAVAPQTGEESRRGPSDDGDERSRTGGPASSPLSPTVQVTKSDGGYMSVNREEALKANWDRIQKLTLPGSKTAQEGDAK
jgi:hypothetical protein